MTIPRIIFIVPYRNREKQKSFFLEKMKYIMEDINEIDYKILFIHQRDERDFNRGAMKNIGFLFVKNQYPNDYLNITLVFNDVDTTPKEKNMFNYETNKELINKSESYFKINKDLLYNIGDSQKLNIESMIFQ